MQTKNINDVGIFSSIEELKPEYINLLKNTMKEGLAAIKKQKNQADILERIMISLIYRTPKMDFLIFLLPYMAAQLTIVVVSIHIMANRSLMKMNLPASKS